MDGFPYTPRDGQPQLIRAIERAQRAGQHLVADAGTGLGKTICALQASKGGGRTIYATRTNSQQTQVMREHRHMEGLAIPFMGRKHYCPLLKDDERFQEGTSEELGRLCRDAKRKATQEHATGKPVKGSCPYYARLLADGTGPVEALLDQNEKEPAELAKSIAAAGACAYEAFKMLMPEAKTVIVPYAFILDTRLRGALLEWMGATSDQCDLIIDEAHNLPEATREHHSPRLGLTTIERALREAEQLQDPVLAGKHLATSFLTTLHQVMRSLVDEHVAEQEDGWMPPGALEEALMMALRAPGPVLERIADGLEEWGEAVREERRRQGRLPRSYLGAVGAFLHMWWSVRDAPYVHLAIREPRPGLEAYLLDPAARLGWLQEFKSTVHLSGTLAPCATYNQLTGLGATTIEIPAPFPAHHLQTWGIHDIRRSHQAILEDPGQIARHQDMARNLLQQWTGRIGVFFPSHQMMEDYLEEGFLHGADAEVFAEEPGMGTQELMGVVRRFQKSRAERVLLVGVLGGRLTEGIDYPGDAMERMLLMGVPYPRPSARNQALIHHYDVRSDNGWQVAVHEPVGRTMRQAIGRLVRGPEDRGLAVVLDERVVRFPDRFPRLHMAKAAPDVRFLEEDVDGFQRASRLEAPPA